MSSDPKRFHFVPKHSRLDMFEENTRQTESWLDQPIVQAVLLCVATVVVVGLLALCFGWRP